MKPWNLKIKQCCFFFWNSGSTGQKITPLRLPPPSLKDVPWLRRLVVGFSPRRPGIEPGPVFVDFVGDIVVPGQVFLPVLLLSPVSIVVPLLLTHLHLLTLR